MERAGISAGRIITIEYLGRWYSLHLDGALTQELCQEAGDLDDLDNVWQVLVSCLDELSIHFYSRSNAVTLMVTRLAAISEMPSVGTGNIEPVRYQCTLHAKLPERSLTCSESSYIAAVGTEVPRRPRIIKVGSYGETAMEAVYNFFERVMAVGDDEIEWSSDVSQKERDFQCLLGDTITATDDLGYVSNAGGIERVILPTLRDRTFAIRERSTALYHRMCKNEWCKIRVVRILDPRPFVPVSEAGPPSEQGDVAIPVTETTNVPTEALVRTVAQAATVYIVGLLRDGGIRNGVQTNGIQKNGVQASGTHTSSSHTNDAHTNGACTNDSHTDGAHTNATPTNSTHMTSAHTNSAHTNGARANGAHMNDACTIGTHTNGARTPESHTDDPHTDEHHTDGRRTVRLQTGGLYTDTPHMCSPQMYDPHTDRAHTECVLNYGAHTNGTRPNGTRPIGIRTPNGTHTNSTHMTDPQTNGARMNGTHIDSGDTSCSHLHGRKRRRGEE